MNPENGMPTCDQCHTDCYEDELELVDGWESDGGKPYLIQYSLCDECAKKQREANKTDAQLARLLKVFELTGRRSE